MTKPFKVESADINRLNDIQLTQLLRELLEAEALKFSISQRSIEVALNIRVGDGGEDGRIQWEGGPEKTDYIPCRLTMFQNKATDMRPVEYAKEILQSDGSVKQKVDEVLSQGGAYIFFTTQELNTKQKRDNRIKKIREKLKELNKPYAETEYILIYDSAQIAGWVNLFVSTVVSVQHWLGKPLVRGLKTYEIWSEYKGLSRLPFVSVESRKDLIETLKTDLSIPKSCFRIMGLSGLGKTRTAFQVFTETKEIRGIMVYVDANHAPNIDALLSDWISLGFRAIVVVDNCEYRLHERLVREITRDGSQMSLLSLDYNFDSISAPTISFKLKQMSDDELLQLLTPVYKGLLPDLDRVVNFAQGFPQMAFLLAEARLNEYPKIGELTEDELANKLLWRHGEEENTEYLKILQVCSLFDVFGVEEEAESQLKYIAHVADFDVDTTYSCVKRYSDRELIDRRGRFGQVVPKPLAIRLAGQWWTKSREQRQKELIANIPEGMVEMFCHQIEKMDFHTNVKLLTEKLCGPQAPFGQAEVILSSRGSRLFRAFVNVNPEATSTALYNTLNNYDHQQLLNVSWETRRNLVWALEKLCFHAHLFEESAWSLLLLSSAETESFSNNATRIFAQLFRVNLSGTEADPNIRFALLQRAIDLNQAKVDMVVLEALKEAINLYGGTRTIGAEHQGMKPPLQEWRASILQEIFDFWQAAFDFLLVIMERGDPQKEKVLKEIGHSIRGFSSKGQIEMLDTAIKKIVEVNGKNWPEARRSINNIFQYDSEGLKQEVLDALNSWSKLLSVEDSDLSEKLKILVISPPWEDRKGDDGHYINVAAMNAMKLATDVVKNINSFFPYLSLLLIGEQRQSYVFGKQLALDLDDSRELLELTLKKLSITKAANINFVLGIYNGIHEKTPETWQIYLDKILDDEQLIGFYPNFLCTGNIKKCHLDVIIKLVNNDIVSAKNIRTLLYGGVTKGVDPETMAEFCLELSTLGEDAAWAALTVMSMYFFSNKECIERIRESIKTLIITVPLHKDKKRDNMDIYHWYEMSETILKFSDKSFALAIANQLIISCRHDFNHGDLWGYIKKLLTKLIKEYGDVLWPIFGEAIVKAEGMDLYSFRQLLKRENNFSDQQPCVLSVLPPDNIISWCFKNPSIGPEFIASCVNVIETIDEELKPNTLFIKLLENFGSDKKVLSALSSNMGSRSWSGSLVPHLETDRSVFSTLLEHHNPNVRKWIREQIAYINKQIKHESDRDAEHGLGIY